MELISPTIITDKDIICEVIKEVTRNPNLKALKRNKEALELLNRLRK